MAEQSSDITDGASERFIPSHPGVNLIQQFDGREGLNDVIGFGNTVQRYSV